MIKMYATMMHFYHMMYNQMMLREVASLINITKNMDFKYERWPAK